MAIKTIHENGAITYDLDYSGKMIVRDLRPAKGKCLFSSAGHIIPAIVILALRHIARILCPVLW